MSRLATVLPVLRHTPIQRTSKTQEPQGSLRLPNARSRSAIKGIPKSLSAGPLVSYRADEDDEDTEVGDDEASVAGPSGSKSGSVRPASPVSFHRTLLNLGPDDVVPLPPEPRGRCAPALQEKSTRLYQRKLRGHCDIIASVQMRKDFRNPSIYEKLIAYRGIDELGNNYPPEAYDPQKWGPESYYDKLSRRQAGEVCKRGKKAKADFLTGTAKKPDSRKGMWDIGGVQPVLGIGNPGFAAPAALSTKPTVIPAFGALPKKPSTSKRLGRRLRHHTGVLMLFSWLATGGIPSPESLQPGLALMPAAPAVAGYTGPKTEVLQRGVVKKTYTSKYQSSKKWWFQPAQLSPAQPSPASQPAKRQPAKRQPAKRQPASQAPASQPARMHNICRLGVAPDTGNRCRDIRPPPPKSSLQFTDGPQSPAAVEHLTKTAVRPVMQQRALRISRSGPAANGN
ncbi:uncharacterized protein [Dermacentor albipictus]|uniref:uncharacterized protein n=1 Tax=Dermacentor albipictus TaxID=60249 RepID=UPI0038FC6B57